MISELDDALRSLLRREVLNGSDVEVVLDAPRKEWAARCTAPTVDLYLYDIREVASRRVNGMAPVQDAHGHVTARKAFSRVFRMTYLITAWTQRPEDEHRLLSAILGCLLRHETFPPDLVVPGLSEPEPPRLCVAQPPPQERQISEIWSALGGELKASLDLAVLAHFDPGLVQAAAPLVREAPRLSVSGQEGRSEAAPRAPGRSRPAAARRARGEVAAVWSGDPGGEVVTGGGQDEPGRTLRVGSMPQR